jgi:hypothetical protein
LQLVIASLPMFHGAAAKAGPCSRRSEYQVRYFYLNA